jgi:hypothetical protein
VIDASLDGGPVVVDGFPPLSSAGVGACLEANPVACQPAAKHVTLTLEGPRSPATDVDRQVAVIWADGSGGSGVCKGDVGAFGDSIGSIDGSIADSAFCDFNFAQCTGAPPFDHGGLRIGRSGPYAHSIQASVVQGACCWEGTAATH